MFIQLLVLVFVGGLLYKLVWSHGCGSSCPREAPPVSTCRCACATCPCSPFPALDVIPKTLQQCYDQGVEHLKEIRAAQRRFVSDVTGRPAEQSERRSTTAMHSPIVIEESHRASHFDFNYPGTPNRDTASTSTSGTSPPIIEAAPPPSQARVPAVCNKCKSRGMTCMRSCPKAKAKRGSNVASNTE